MTVWEEIASVAAVPMGRAAIVLAATAVIMNLVLWYALVAVSRDRDAAIDRLADRTDRKSYRTKSDWIKASGLE